MANVTHEQEARDTLHVATLEVAEELERTLKEQGRLQDDLDNSSDALTAASKDFTDFWAAHEATGVKLCNAFRKVSNRPAAHEELCVDAKKALQRTLEVKRKATEIQEDVAIHTRLITNEHARAAGNVNDGIGSLGKAPQAAARATHSLTCGVPDRESNEVKYLREATNLIEEWQYRLQSGQMSRYGGPEQVLCNDFMDRLLSGCPTDSASSHLISSPTQIQQVGDRIDFVQEGQLALPGCTMVLAICALVDVSKYLDILSSGF